MNTKSVKANRINVENLCYCLVLSDDTEGTTYGSVESLGSVMQVQITPSLSTGTLYGEGVQTENIAKMNGIAVVVDVNKIKIEDRAAILGNTYTDGVLIENTSDEPPYIAIGWKVPQTNNKCEYVWMLKGRAQPFNSNPKQSEGNINFSTDSITINCIPRDSDKKIRFFADTANAEFTEAQAAKWFTTGPSTYPVKA